MLVIMSMATDFRAVGPAAGLAIGGTVGLEAMFAGPLCGAIQPAAWDRPWPLAAYIVGPLLGAAAGALFYEFICCQVPSGREVKGCC